MIEFREGCKQSLCHEQELIVIAAWVGESWPFRWKFRWNGTKLERATRSLLPLLGANGLAWIRIPP